LVAYSSEHRVTERALAMLSGERCTKLFDSPARPCYRLRAMRTDDFDFALPPELIAQVPAGRRDASRLLVLDRPAGRVTHEQFRDLLRHLRSGDVLVLNNSRVLAARLRGVKTATGGHFEVLLLEENSLNDWWAMMRPAKRAPVGTRIRFLDHSGAPTDISADVISTNEEGHRRLRFQGADNILGALNNLGELPLPPYIERPSGRSGDTDLDRYQTVFAEPTGSVAAPTAGLHFTPQLLEEIRALGAQTCFVTLHVGLGTFAPVKAETLEGHIMHEERFEVAEAVATAVNNAKREGRRVIAVGTTSVRVLESVAQAHKGKMVAGSGRTRIFIHPPHKFGVVDALLTNFHLPRSTLLMLVSAFATPGELGGRERILAAYAEAVRERYRFFSYGDAMFIQ
jgi:S-adenosylmethionine:tRNA ribosyltransferase-isomerase